MGNDGHTASLVPGAAGLEIALDRDNPALARAITPPASTGMGLQPVVVVTEDHEARDAFRAIIDNHVSAVGVVETDGVAEPLAAAPGRLREKLGSTRERPNSPATISTPVARNAHAKRIQPRPRRGGARCAPTRSRSEGSWSNWSEGKLAI